MAGAGLQVSPIRAEPELSTRTFWAHLGPIQLSTAEADARTGSCTPAASFFERAFEECIERKRCVGVCGELRWAPLFSKAGIADICSSKTPHFLHDYAVSCSTTQMMLVDIRAWDKFCVDIVADHCVGPKNQFATKGTAQQCIPQRIARLETPWHILAARAHP